MPASVLLTGATGFVGSSLYSQLIQKGHKVTKALRVANKGSQKNNPNSCVIGSILGSTDWDDALKSIDVVIHAAGRAHVFEDQHENPLEAFRDVNTRGTLNLAEQAHKFGVQRFVFISSIGVNGNTNMKPFTENDIPNPQEAYAVSKYEAEEALLLLSKKVGMEIVIIRPPLVYAKHAPGNFGRLVEWVKRGVPLPFALVHNWRSLIALDNLVDFIILCAEHPKAANEIFLISDGVDVSTTELLRKVGKALGKPARLIPIPVALMRFMASLVGKQDMAERLFASLQVDSSKARDLLGWEPIVTMDEQLRKTVEVYKK